MQTKQIEKKDYKDAVKFSLAYQLILLLLSSLILDNGFCFRYMLATMAVFWVSVVILILIKPEKFKQAILVYIKFGFFLVLFLLYFIMSISS